MNGLQFRGMILETIRYKLVQNNPTSLLPYLIFIRQPNSAVQQQLVPGNAHWKDPVYNTEETSKFFDHAHTMHAT